MESSGGPEVLCISDVLASGSVSGFLAGKHVNRCNRLHPLFATALEILHFPGFIEKHGWMTDDIMALLHELGGNVCMKSLSAILQTDACTKLLERYDEYCGCTWQGEHGKTAMFWMTYIDLVKIYLLLDRACRTNDVYLYIYALGQMLSVFFTTHRPQLCQMDDTLPSEPYKYEHSHPGIRPIFEGGALSIRCTSKSFSRSAVDLTLEQTVNRDAASRQTGIAAFTQCVKARKRWTKTRTVRGAVVGCLLEMAG